MKDKILITAIIVVILVAIGGITYGFRLFSNISTPVTLHEVKQGVTCATMVTADGVAIDCWKD